MNKLNRRFLLGLSGGAIVEGMLTGCASLVSGGERIAIRDTDISAFEAALALPSGAPLISYQTNKRPVKIYKVAFDGTLNDQSRVPVGERKTIVAQIASHINADEYYAGAGMQNNDVDILDALTGESCERVAETARGKFFAQAKRWLSDEPNVEIRVFVTGFSRGAATARHFMNLTEEGWGALFGSEPKSTIQDTPRFFALLYDTVATGQQDRLRLQLANSVDYLVHFVATDEPRNAFIPTLDVDSVPPLIDAEYIGSALKPPNRINTIYLPGAHSDVGASYQDGIGDLYLVLTEQFLYMMGLTKTNCWDVRSDPFANGKHDSRGLLDKLFGSPEPNSVVDVERRKHLVAVPNQVLSERVATANRLKEFWLANFDRMAGMSWSMQRRLTAFFEIRKSSSGMVPLSVSPHIDPASVNFKYKGSNLHMNFKFREGNEQSNLILNSKVIDHIKERGSVLSITYLDAPNSLSLAIFVDNVMQDLLTMSIKSETKITPQQQYCIKRADGSNERRVKAFVIRADGSIFSGDTDKSM